MDNHTAAPTPALVLVSASPLCEEVRRIAAAAGRTIDEHATLPARHPFLAAPVIILDTLSARNCAAAGHPRRPGILLVTADEPSLLDWQTATRVGAEQVLQLPAESDTLITAFATHNAHSRTTGAVVAIAGACGGAGASTLAAAVALTAATHFRDRTLLVDAAPYGGGLDLLLGIEQTPGLRWPDLVIENGRISAAALHQALPAISGVSVLSCGTGSAPTDFDDETAVNGAKFVPRTANMLIERHPVFGMAATEFGASDAEHAAAVHSSATTGEAVAGTPITASGTIGKSAVAAVGATTGSASAAPWSAVELMAASADPVTREGAAALSPVGMAAVVEAGRSAGDLVVCDLSAERGAHTEHLLEAADLVVLITPARLRAVAAAESVRAHLIARNPNVRLVVRGPAPGGLRGADIATTLDLPLLAAVPPQPGLPERLERAGLTVNRRGPLRTAAAAVLQALPLATELPRTSSGTRSAPRRRTPTTTCVPAHADPIASNPTNSKVFR
ncbi:septum site-determining protein Ssd [Nocardia inohanensis]|uniref:septum site-determining protein Ssd n=1 Tax=Nocardia inohanensis TaxID=209246 RepID=UPI000AEF6865|nr:septum site-determining protein Ssd [Nocardia inohanensis]